MVDLVTPRGVAVTDGGADDLVTPRGTAITGVAAGGDVTISVDTVAISVTAQTVTLIENVIVPVDTVAISVTPQTVTVVEGIILSVDTVAVSVTPQAVTIIEDVVLSVDTASVSVTPQTVTIVAPVTVPVDTVSISVTPQTVTIVDATVFYKTLTVKPSGGDYASVTAAFDAEMTAVSNDITGQSGHLLIEVYNGDYTGGSPTIVNEVEILTADLNLNTCLQDADHRVVIRPAAGEEALGRYRGGTSATTWLETGDYAAPCINTGAGFSVIVRRWAIVTDLIIDAGANSTDTNPVEYTNDAVADGGACVRRCTISTIRNTNAGSNALYVEKDHSTLTPLANTTPQLGDISHNMIVGGSNQTTGAILFDSSRRIYRVMNNTIWCQNTSGIGFRTRTNMEGIIANNLVLFTGTPTVSINNTDALNFEVHFKNNASVDDDEIRDVTAGGDPDPVISGNLGTGDGLSTADVENIGTDFRLANGSDLVTSGLALWDNDMLITITDVDTATMIDGTALAGSGTDWFIGAYGEAPAPVGGRRRRARLHL